MTPRTKSEEKGTDKLLKNQDKKNKKKVLRSAAF